MKKSLLVTLVVLAQLGYAGTLRAECQVKSNSDAATDSNQLRYITSYFIHNTSNPYCNHSTGSGEEIKFMGAYEITLNAGAHSFTARKATTHVTKSTSVSGYPIIDGSVLSKGQKPFDVTCTGGGTFVLNDIVIISNGVPEYEQIDGSCVTEGSNAYVCASREAYDNGITAGKAPGESGWCDEVADNDIDDDSDGDIDCEDSDLIGTDECPKEDDCDDGIDNDGDGDIDCEDSDCPLFEVSGGVLKPVCYEAPDFGEVTIPTLYRYWVDMDRDGYGNPSQSVQLPDSSPPAGFSDNWLDCNDNDPDYNVGANACTGELLYPDNDGDGYGDDGVAGVPDTEAPDGYVDNNDDCNDGNGDVNPGEAEICDGIDNNCSGIVDEGFDSDGDGTADCFDSEDVIYYPDVDLDGYGDDAHPGTTDPASVDNPTTNNDDCNDANGDVNPGEAEICDGIDNNCSGTVDEGFDSDGDGTADCFDSEDVIYYPDADGDDYGDADHPGTTDPASVDNPTTNNEDCDDVQVGVNPGASEICDGIDNNCSGTVDEGFDADGDGTADCFDSGDVIYYPDVDLDGYGDDNHPGATDPTSVDNPTTNNEDCNDASQSINPAATEVCDGIDNNCDTNVDEGLTCNLTDVPETACSDGVDNDSDGGTDCRDSDCDGQGACMDEEGVGSDNEDSCFDGIDNDGDGSIDCSDSGCADECTDIVPEGSGNDPEAECSNEDDDDFDGFSDCLDSGCAQTEVCINLDPDVISSFFSGRMWGDKLMGCSIGGTGLSGSGSGSGSAPALGFFLVFSVWAILILQTKRNLIIKS